MPIISRKERSHPWRNLSPGQQARVALMRFGLGPKPGIAPRLASEDGAAFRACLREIEGPEAADALLLPDEEVKTACSDPAGDVVLDYANCCRFGAVFRRPFTPQPGTVFNAEYAARYAKALEPEVGYGERLVHFWSNHFSIFGSKATATVGHFERSVIRKHALGKFVDMLKAVYQHPAMICNLDNQVSVGPNSRFAKTHKHLAPNINENLAREIFELHTLGIDGGHSQDDVTNFAKILTGWTVYPGYAKTPGQFYFAEDRHEPRPQTVLGVSYSQTGIDQGLAVLEALANHPATAQHIAYKLVRHFLTDEPPPYLVAYLARLFRFTGGDLSVMAKALICLPQFWSEPMNRLIQPLPWYISILRGLGISKETVLKREDWGSLNTCKNAWTFACGSGALSQSPWGRPTPDGFPDDNYFWQNGHSVRIRKDVAIGAVNLALADTGRSLSSYARADDLLSGFRSEATAAIFAEFRKRKPPEKYVLTSLFVSPEYSLR